MTSKSSGVQLLRLYHDVYQSRRFDERLIQLYKEQKAIVELPHSHIGQEAIGVGACSVLREDDYVLPSLRTRPALFMRGVTPKEMMAGIYAKAAGPARAKVTTHHMGDNKKGIIGTTGVVGGHLSVATGVALACKLKKRSSVVLCFFGDGASNRGDFHEGLNFASVKSLPVIFIVENNKYAMWTPFAQSFNIRNIADRAIGYGIPGAAVDGDDVFAVYDTVRNAVERARAGEGPTLIECKTHRHKGHTERLTERRPQAEIEEWAEHDPVKRLREHLLQKKISEEELQGTEKAVDAEIEEAIRFAEGAPFPDKGEILKDVYSEGVKVDEPPESKGEMKEITMGEALSEALREEMERDKNVFMIGEDIGVGGVGPVGGLWPPTRGLCELFPDQVVGTPLSEGAIVGAAVGAALVGMRPVAEVMFADFITLVMDQIVNYAAKMRYNYGGGNCVPMVVRMPTGESGRNLGLHHGQSPEAWILNVPGLKVVTPSTPYDAKGLLKASIRDDDPVIFFENKRIYGIKGKIPKQEYLVPLGKADVKREGSDVTVVATAAMVHEALSAAEVLQGQGISVEVLDPRTLLPLDEEAILRSVRKTGRLIIAHEAPKTYGFGGEVAALVMEKALEYLDAPLGRIGAPFAPVPYSPPLVEAYLPGRREIASAVLKAVRGQQQSSK